MDADDDFLGLWTIGLDWPSLVVCHTCRTYLSHFNLSHFKLLVALTCHTCFELLYLEPMAVAASWEILTQLGN